MIANRIRRLRTQAGLTLTEVAARADLTKSALSKIETGRISPPISTLSRIGRAMRVRLTDFFADGEPSPAFVLTRKSRGRHFTRDESQFGYAYEALALVKADKLAEPFLLTIRPGDAPGKFHHGGQEFIYMLQGRMEFTFDDEPVKLHPGDSIYFDSTHVHRTRLLGNRPAKFLCVFKQEPR